MDWMVKMSDCTDTLEVVLIDCGAKQLQSIELALLMQRGINVVGWASEADSGVRQVIQRKPHAVVLAWDVTTAQIVAELRGPQVPGVAPRLIIVVDGEDAAAAAAAGAIGADAVLPQRDLGHRLGPVIQELAQRRDRLQ
jgi:DNA-binding NarL/FixJ family response regulator